MTHIKGHAVSLRNGETNNAIGKMDGMKDFPPEFTRPFVISFNYFMSCNIKFFNDNVPFWQKYWRFFIMSVIVVLNFISMLMYTIYSFGSQMNIPDIAFMTTVCLLGLQTILKAIVLLPKKKDIEDLIRGLAKMWKMDLSDAQMKEKNRRLKQLNVTLTVFYWTSKTAVFVNLVSQLIHSVVRKIRGHDFDFILPFGYVYPFDPVKNWRRYLLVYIMQYYAIVRLINYYISVQCLVIASCSQLSTEFALLREDIKYAVPMPNKNKITQELHVDKNMTIESMIKNHQELIKLAQFINKIFNQLVFIDMCFLAVMLCLQLLCLSVTHNAVDKISNILSILSLLSLVYIFCYYCEMLKVESEGIAEAAYENPWYEGGTHYQKTIRFIIMRAQRPCYLTSLNYAPISLNTFYKVVSTAWSYFSLAMTMCGDK